MTHANGSISSTLLHRIEINVDCGEAFGLWEGGPDEELMPMIDAANVACGGHAGDPVTMQKTVALAKKYGIKVGARESRLRDEWMSPAKLKILVSQTKSALEEG
jgi:UPF0271 protein